MPRAEAGSTKAIGNKIKAKGLGRLRWYCQACERQMRDANGFKCHITSESHVRQMLIIGENPNTHIKQFSEDFKKNFIDLLKTTHGTKEVNINHFYQQVIADKQHIHMNATQWKSLTQFASYLGKEGICHVNETEKGIFVSWIDNSPETLRKREAIAKKERQDKGDEEREQRAIQEQIKRAQAQADALKDKKDDTPEEDKLLPGDGEKMKLKLEFAPKPKEDSQPDPADSTTDSAAQAPAKFSMSLGAQKPKNVFSAAAKKNPLAGKKGPVMPVQKKMTEQERIMKAEMEAMERKRSRPGPAPAPKRTKIA
ncbi:KIN17-like protein [Penicillium chermesinum]|uniref:KIN17-like protein n=1 Tax=Penicillium chermesinum TaxID=63820 RepID=A0A9W9NGT6_9EURO|nr:KIN17-like protein [Penicillium chermesinum]KAJ5219717.1 KIN17-like protein [Penicillium chermesinum]KAJ6153716.1 KIN17-like protein [Penicillium chermesinum]